MTPRERTLNLIATVCEQFDVCPQDVLGRTRFAHIVRARFQCYADLYAMGLTASEIGRVFKRDHSTILHGLKRAENQQLVLFARWRRNPTGKVIPVIANQDSAGAQNRRWMKHS